MVRWEGERFLVLIKGVGCRVSPRLHLFVSGGEGEYGAIGIAMYFYGGISIGWFTCGKKR